LAGLGFDRLVEGVLKLLLESGGDLAELADHAAYLARRTGQLVRPQNHQGYDNDHRDFRPSEVAHADRLTLPVGVSTRARLYSRFQMAPRITALRIPPIGFAHRGARARERENTLAAFSVALEMGATGLESDVWVTADGQAVLDHDGVVRANRWRRRRIADCPRSELPDHIPTLDELFRACGGDFELSLDLKDPDAAAPAIASVDAAAARLGASLRPRLWLCHPDVETLVRLRRQWPDVRLCNSTRLSRFEHGPERRAAVLADAGIDSVNLHQTDWTGGLVTLFHRFGILCFGWDAQFPRVLNELLDMGVDGVFSDHVDRMGDALASWYPDR